MKFLLLIILALSLVSSCTFRPKEKRLATFTTDDKILESFYRKVGDTIEFKRILSNGTNLKFQWGQLFTGDYALIQQRLRSLEMRNEPNIVDSLRTQLAGNGFVKKILDKRDVMFIQIVPDSAMSNLDHLGFLNLRQDVEEKIDERLRRQLLGEWFAGDMGAGGNMLFFVDDWSRSIQVVMEVLKEESLLDSVLIAKRIMTDEEDWTYEVVFPTEYQGVFNEM